MEFFKEILGKIWYILYPFLFLLCGDADYYDNCTVGIWRRCHTLCVLSADCHCFYNSIHASVLSSGTGTGRDCKAAVWNQPGTYLSCTFCGRDYGMLWNFFEQSHIHDETDGNFDGLPAGKYRFLRKYNRNGNSLSGSIYPDSGGTGIPGDSFWKIKRYAVETICGWNFRL